MNLRSELLEVFGPEVGHALSISSWDRLEEWVKRKLADSAAATAASCVGLFAKRADRLLRDMRGRLRRDPDIANFKGAFEDEVRALLPDPELLAKLERVREIACEFLDNLQSVHLHDMLGLALDDCEPATLDHSARESSSR